MAQTVLGGRTLDARDALYLLEVEGNDRYDLLYWANRIRLERYGEEISLCCIASARTGLCSEDCRFCSQSSRYDTAIESQETSGEQLLAAAEQAKKIGAHRFGIVASGQRPSKVLQERLEKVLGQIEGIANLECCASLGCLDTAQAHELYELGVRRYNHNLETSRRFFPQVVTTHSYGDRINTVKAVQEAGMKVCCGGIIGLGESREDRAELAMTLRELDVDGVPINVLHPIAGTPFGGNPPLPPMTVLQTIAMFRFILPDKDIKIAGGRIRNLRDLQSWVFFAGASSCMIGNYLTTPGRSLEEDYQMLRDLELIPPLSE
jgi:biotin synthase